MALKWYHKILKIFGTFIILFILGTGSVTAGCDTNYLPIDGNLISNPYFECDDNTDGIPDGWMRYAADDFHQLMLADDPTNSGNGRVLKSQYIDNKNPNSFGWLAQQNLTLKLNTWYELKITYLTENTGLNLTPEQTIDVTSNWIGFDLDRYTINNQRIYYPISGIFPPTQHFTSWDDPDKVYRTFSSVNSSGWNTKTIYFRTTPFESYATPRTINYTPGTLYLAHISLKETIGNTNPEFVPFKRSGTINAFSLKNQPFFPIIINNYPKLDGEDLDIDQIVAAGINTVGDRYRNYSDGEFRDLVTAKNLAVKIYVNCLPWSTEHGCAWVNDPDSTINYTGFDYATGHIDTWKNFDRVLMYDAIQDELDCNSQSLGAYINFLKTYQMLHAYIRSNTTIPIYGNYCGGTYTYDYDDEVQYYLSMADIFSFTFNTHNAYDRGSAPGAGAALLPQTGYNIRRALDATATQGPPKKALAFGLGTYHWSSWNGNEYNENSYIPFTLQRFQVWDQIINGATGVLFFLYNVNLNDPYYNHHFQQMKAITTELQSLNSVLLEPNFVDEWSVSDARVNIMMKKSAGKLYLFTASTATEDLKDITISLDHQYTITSITALNDISNGEFRTPANRTISPVSANTFTDDFTGENTASPQGQNAPGYGVHIYEIEYQTIAPTPSQPSIPGDANGDNRVDGLDYIVWLTHYGQNVSGASNGNFNGDTKVDGLDYIVWLTNYGR